MSAGGQMDKENVVIHTMQYYSAFEEKEFCHLQ